MNIITRIGKSRTGDAEFYHIDNPSMEQAKLISKRLYRNLKRTKGLCCYKEVKEGELIHLPEPQEDYVVETDGIIFTRELNDPI